MPVCRRVALTVLLSLGSAAMCQTRPATPAPAIVPNPVQLELLAEHFVLDDTVQIVSQHANAEILAIAGCLAERLYEQTGLRPKVSELGSFPSRLPQGTIMVILLPGDPDLGDEGYVLSATNFGVMLGAYTPTGLFRGAQTLRQLVTRSDDGGWRLPGVMIRDYPRYKWRGMLLDCCRHFMTKEFVKRQIDLLAYHKMNVLHWHLTEDQGWRIEIRKYPRLTEVGAWRKITRDSEKPGSIGEVEKDGMILPTPFPADLAEAEIEQLAKEGKRYGGFYTQDDVKEIVAYARSRYVTVVPEIEMPGHSMAAVASYPELSCRGGEFEVGTIWGVWDDVYCAGNDRVFEMLEDILAEVIELFPSEYVHIGGDECPKTRWKSCPKCQARMKAEGLKDENELQSYFIRRVERFLNSKGKRLVGWDEILEGGLAPNATVQSWRGMDGAIAAARAGHDVICSPTTHCYLDYPQWPMPGGPAFFRCVTPETTYSFEPTPAELTAEQRKHVLGLEGNMWTERAPQSRVDWQVWPRLAAIAEAGWSPAERRQWADFERRMRAHYPRLDALGVRYFVPAPLLVARSDDATFTFVDNEMIEFDRTACPGTIHYTLDGSDPTPESPAYQEPIRLTASTLVKARTVLSTRRASELFAARFRKLEPLPAVDAADARPGLHYRVYDGHWLKLPALGDVKPQATGACDLIAPECAKRTKDYVLILEGYIEAPADGVYTFWLTSDDGSRFAVHDEVVIDNDGLHAATTLTGRVMFKQGRHPIRLEYLQGDGRQVLDLSWQRPDGVREQVPAGALSHRTP